MSEMNNGATMSGESNGRNNSGRFTAGNKGGPGNPFARQTAALRKAIQEAVTPAILTTITGVMASKALGGDVAAARLLFSYAAGTPRPTSDPDTLDAHELAVRRSNTASPEDIQALFEKMPAGLLCAIAATLAPHLRAHLEQAFAEGVKRQDEAEPLSEKVNPDAPGPSPDQAAERFKQGLSSEVRSLFEACPVWMPSVSGEERLPAALGDMFRAARRELLDNLKGPGADQRQSATSTDSKRGKPTGGASSPPRGDNSP